jgi:oxygen-dependent protoporphyrinogen oxidase
MRHVAIIGGGLAGLTCAFTLKRYGIPSTVFEANRTCGGRCPAAAYLLGMDLYLNTFNVIQSLGLRNDLIEIRPIAGQYYKGRVYHHRVSSATGLLGFKGLNIADKALLSRMAYLLVRYGPKLDFRHPERGAALDDETTATFVKRELSQNILNYVAGPLISTLFYYSSEETSKLLYLNLAKHMHNLRMHTLKGGLGRLAAVLAEQVNVRTGQRVDSIAAEGASYRVNAEEFSDVVVAVPGDAVLCLAGVRDLLGDTDRAFFENCRYGRAVTVTVQADREVDRCYALSIPRVERLHAATIIFHDFIDPESVGGSRRVTVVGGGESVTARELLDDLTRIYGLNPDGYSATEWKSAKPKFPPGRYRELAGFLARTRRPGLFFCGDYLMGPFIEGAVISGQRAAEDINSKLKTDEIG